MAKIRRDDGFILLEVLISLVMIGFLMGSLTFLYARSTGIQAQQGSAATAEEVASSRMEQVRVLDPSAITAGSASSTISGIVYTATWTPDVCWQAADPASTDTSCVAGASAPNNTIQWAEFVRVRVVVTWPERNCPGGTCSLDNVTLISRSKAEPVFDPGP